MGSKRDEQQKTKKHKEQMKGNGKSEIRYQQPTWRGVWGGVFFLVVFVLSTGSALIGSSPPVS